MAAGDTHLGIAFHPACRWNPVVVGDFVRAVSIYKWHITRTASEHTAYPRLAVGSIVCTASRILITRMRSFPLVSVGVVGVIYPISAVISSVW